MTTPQSLTNGSLEPTRCLLISQGNETALPNHHTLPQEDDAALLQRVVEQDRQAFDTLYVRYVPRLQHYLAHRLNDTALAEDVCQDVMLVVWQQAGRIPATVPLWAWVCGIARHKAHKAWARTSSRALAPAEPADRQETAPDVLLLRQEARRVLEQALSLLPFYERTTLVWLMQHGYSYQEIAARMDIPVSTVRTRLWRAGQRLRASIAATDPALPRSQPARVSAGQTRPRVSQPRPSGR
jgi:RNA polymerase sigma-70 factor, ECF subfamily